MLSYHDDDPWEAEAEEDSSTQIIHFRMRDKLWEEEETFHCGDDNIHC